MYLIILILPLLSSIITGFFGQFIGNKGSMIVSNIYMLTTVLFSILAFLRLGVAGNYSYIVLGNWINSEMLNVKWGFLLDSLTVTMFIVVTLISTLVHLYSCSYMQQDPHIARFMSYLSLFTFFMLVLVSADNFLQMFLGWEGVGLCSYLLISFWFTRIQANKSAIKAMIMNRLGDFGLFLGILSTFFIFRSLDFCIVFSLVPFIKNQTFFFFNSEIFILHAIAIFFFIGSVGKSAQLGLHTWLPDAMEGPTPVSALIHAATMVTAGVFLIIRCSSFFEYAPVALNIVSIIGALTAFFAATVGVLQNDIKKVIAYSTCSQLGYMVFICGLSNYPLSLFHLFNHAFFKALLFLGAGAIIHSLSNEQDMRKMGGLLRILPFTYSAMLIASFALMGFPFLSGFYSKDIILEVSYSVYSVSSNFSYLLGTVSAFFTAFYSIRLLFLVFVVKTNAYKYKIKNLHELDFITAVTLTILCLGSCFSGFYFKDLFIGLGSNFFNQAIFIKPNNISLVDSEFLPFYIKLIPSFFSIFGALLSATLFYSNPKLLSTLKITKFGYFFYKYLNQKWYFDQIYNYFIGIRVLKFGYDFTFNLIDKGFIELIGPKGFTQTFYNLSFRITTFQTGFFFHYTCLFLIGWVYFWYLFI